MTFRPRKGNYITQRRGRYYYRRIVPESHHEVFGKKVLMLPLSGENDATRQREALALAAEHDRILRQPVIRSAEDLPDVTELRVDYGAHDDGSRPIYHDGQPVEVSRVAISNDPARLRQATKDGYYPMSEAQAALQDRLFELEEAFNAAGSDVERENAGLKGAAVAAELDRLSAAVASHTVLSILEPWRAHRKQAPTTWKKHAQYAAEFADLHGDLPLGEVTKRHVVEYVEHWQAQTRKDSTPYSPTSISKRLDSIKALFAYAVAADHLDANPAAGVKAPRDTRPKTAKSWKSFERAEVQKLVTVATDLWSSRRASRNEGRRDDLVTALHVLIWTGARPEEICQLRRSDVDLAEGAITITNDETDDAARARTVKNENSNRQVPIHPRLLPILAEHVRRSNAPLLFPSFEPKPTPEELATAKRTGQPIEIKGRYARPISREWTDYLRAVIAPNEPRKVLYSLRHSWAAESRRIGMPEYVRNAIMGHADDNPHAGRYGNDADWLAEKRRHVEAMTCA